MRGPTNPPNAKAAPQMPIARCRSFSFEKRLTTRDKVEGANAEQRARNDELLRRARERGERGRRAERKGADEQYAPAADPVAERAHGHEEAGNHEDVDVVDPEKFRCRRIEIRHDGGHRQKEDG